MWICMNNAFFSIVDDGKVEGCLVVRARRQGDIEKVFGVEAETLRRRDYQFRAHVAREKVAEVIAESVKAIDYDNFKNSVADDDLHEAYAKFWHIHASIQPQAPYTM